MSDLKLKLVIDKFRIYYHEDYENADDEASRVKIIMQQSSIIITVSTTITTKTTPRYNTAYIAQLRHLSMHLRAMG